MVNYNIHKFCLIKNVQTAGNISKLVIFIVVTFIKLIYVIYIKASLTCSYMRNIGTSGLSALTLDQINNLDDTEFTDCVDILGAVTEYSTDQTEALANVGKRSTVRQNISICTYIIHFFV